MKKTFKKIIVPLISLILSVTMLFNFIGCSVASENNLDNGDNNISLPPVIDDGTGDADATDDSVYATIPTSVVNFAAYSAKVNDDAASVELPVDEVEGFGVDYKVDENEGIKSYSISGGVNVVFDSSVDSYTVTDAITVDDQIAFEQIYYQTGEDDNLFLNEIYADYYQVEIDYTESDKVHAIYFIDDYYEYGYDSLDRLISIHKNAQLYKSIEYNAADRIFRETNVIDGNSNVITYSYTLDGALYSINDAVVNTPVEQQDNAISVGENTFILENNVVSQINGATSGSFAYDYTFNGVNYLTSKDIDGVITEYCYLGDKVVGIRRGTKRLNYILDNNLNYVGLKYDGQNYYFDVDPYGNVLGLMDCDGNYVVEYAYDVWGTPIYMGGSLADSLGLLNEVTNMNGLYDHTLNAYFIGNTLYLPADGVVLGGEGESFSAARPFYGSQQSSYFTRSAVTEFARIHDKVVSVALDNMKDAGLDVVSNLYAVDEAGNTRRLVDIYTLDYSLAPFSAMNLINGNQIYEVIYHSPDSMAFESIASDKLSQISKDWAVSYFADYNAVPGTMQFRGQFVYCGYLIDYKCDGAGIVEYQVKVNKKSNYDQTINIYDYDNSRYICYVNNTFDLNFLDGVTIIPGITRETFDVIDNYLSDYMQSVCGDICDQMLIYDDPAYYNMEEMNVYPDYWSQMNLSDSTTYLEIQKDGSVELETMPAWETDGFMTKLLIGAGVVLVTAVVAAVVISIPGLNGCVVASICVGAAKGAAIGALQGFAFGAIAGGAGELVGQLVSGQPIDWEKIASAAAGAAADGFMTGAITGAIMGGIQGGLKPTYCFEAGTPVVTENGAVAIEDITVGDRVLSYDYVTGEQSYQTVTATSIRQTNELVVLSVGGEQIVTTPRHPFYVVNDDTYHGYTAAEYLSAGDCILTADGDYAVIESVEKQLLADPIDVYNFTVENNHSYYVGDSQLLVHNAGGCENVTNLKVNQRNLQHEFKHAKDFGVSGDWNNENKAKFMKAIVDHLDDPNTVSKLSTYRGQPVTVYYNKITGNGVYLHSETGEFWCGWKLTPDQIKFHGF